MNQKLFDKNKTGKFFLLFNVYEFNVFKVFSKNFKKHEKASK